MTRFFPDAVFFRLCFNVFLLYIASSIIRVVVLGCYILPKNGHMQPDTPDYHVGALGISHGIGMYHVATKEPLFWRTPAYPAFLALFLDAKKTRVWWGIEYYKNEYVQIAWWQIFLTSIIPALVFLLAFVCVKRIDLALLCGWISVLHGGFIAASCFILSDALALIPWLLWAILFFSMYNASSRYRSALVVVSAIFFACYTWIRPNGLWLIPIIAALFLLQNAVSWSVKLGQAALFLVTAMICISPWVFRNYYITGKLFYCPMAGPILQVFSAPKLLRRDLKIPIYDAWKIMVDGVAEQIPQQRHEHALKTEGKFLPRELVAYAFTVPIIANNFYAFMYDWLVQCCKTTFDLFSYQYAAIEKQIHTWDPIEEFLSEKWYIALQDPGVSMLVHISAIIEVIYLISLWVGLFIGLILYGVPLIVPKNSVLYSESLIWMCLILISAALIGLTGGFGYARLRLPIEPFLLIAAVAGWYQAITRKPGFLLS